MSKVSTSIAFVVGAAIGASGAWYYLKDKYAKIAEEEIASVKAAYARREEPVNAKAETTVIAAAKNKDKASIAEYTQHLQEAGYTDYSRTVEEKPSGVPGEVPYVISPDEFGEIEEYTKVSLMYFDEDGILADECGEVVDDVEEIIGDGLEHFGEYEEDSVFVRSDAKRCDYEILKHLGSFHDYAKNFPPNNDKEV